MTEFIDASGEVKENKKTVFTHVLDIKQGWLITKKQFDDDYIAVAYLGNCNIDGDMFSATYIDKFAVTKKYIKIFKGTKGSEF